MWEHQLIVEELGVWQDPACLPGFNKKFGILHCIAVDNKTANNYKHI
jgi:hypothetical protein